MKKCLLLLVSIIASWALYGQSTCSEAVTATEGINVLPSTTENFYWYRYTMPSDGKLQITSSSNSYVGVYSNTCDNLVYEGGKYETVAITTFSSGDEVFIQWDTFSNGDFQWDISISPLETGDNCELAAPATTGANTLSATANKFYWYSFTMPSDGKLQINSSTYNDIEVYKNSCDNSGFQDRGYRSLTVTTLNSGDEVFIKWEASNDSDFDWNLAVNPIEPGDECALAVPATEGTNTIPTTLNDEYWYSYTMPMDGKLQINSSSSKRLRIYTNSCDDLDYESGGYEDLTVTTLSSGDEVFIAWNTQGEGDFEWDLSVSPLEPGDECALAVPATEGVNTVPVTLNNQYWYSYTMPVDGKLQINSSSSKNMHLYTNSCDNLQYESNGNKHLTVTTLSSGDEVFISWDVEGEGDFDWNLAASPLEAGDKCALAKPAVAGTNTIPTTLNDEYWYSYTMPMDGKLQINSSSSKNMYLYTNSCDNLQYESNGNKHLTVTTLSSGDEIFIAWSTQGEGDFDWNLSVGPLEAGDNCTFAAAATLGTNTLPTTLNVQYWYRYTMPIDGKLEISSSEYVSVYANSCDNLKFQGGGFENLTITTLNSGDEVFILWYTNGEGDFEWDLSVGPLEAGDNCAFAAAAAPGLNATPEAPYWFQYKVPVSGDYTISSIGSDTIDTYLKVYSDCNNILIDENDDIGIELYSELTLSLIAGDTIYILWDDIYATDGFNWTLGGDALKDIDCANLTATVEATNVVCYGAANGSINVSATGGQAPYSYSLDKVNFQESARFAGLDSGRYEVMVKDVYGCLATVETYITEPDTIILDAQISEATKYPGNGVITLTVKGGIAPYSYAWSNGATTSLVRDLSVGTYTVTVTDASGCTATGNFTIGGVTSVGEVQTAEIMVYPNPTRNTVNIDIPISRPAKQGNVYTLTGEKIITINLVRGKNQVDVSYLKPGSYILRLDNGSNHRLVVKP